MIIARFSYPKALACMAFTALFAVLPWWAILSGWQDRNGVEASQDGVIWLLLFVSPLTMLASLILAWSMLSSDSRSMRISDGLLFYPSAMGRSFFRGIWLFPRHGFSAFRRDDCVRSIPLADITAFSIGTFNADPVSGPLVYFVFLIAGLFSHDAPLIAGGGATKGILAHIRGGRTVPIPAYLMDSPRDIILARLNQALAESQH